LFKVAVGDVPFGIAEGDKTVLDLLGEGRPPYKVPLDIIKVDATHSDLGGISCSQKVWVLRHYLREVRRSMAETRR
jgi:hypothetical protein